MQYTEPVKKLIKLGDPRELIITRKWPDYKTFGLSDNNIPQLIELLDDWDLYFSDEGSPESWAALHAWRALGQLKAKESIDALMQLIEDLEDENDWAREEIPVIMGMIGEDSISTLKSYLYNNSLQEHVRIAAAGGITEVGIRNSSEKEKCIKILADFIIQSSRNLAGLNGLIICDLIDLEAISAIDSIRVAIDKDVVDISIPGDLEDIELALGIRESRNTPKPNYAIIRDNYYNQRQIKKRKIGRNDPCPCGSGKKFKKCCLRNA